MVIKCSGNNVDRTINQLVKQKKKPHNRLAVGYNNPNQLKTYLLIKGNVVLSYDLLGMVWDCTEELLFLQKDG